MAESILSRAASNFSCDALSITTSTVSLLSPEAARGDGVSLRIVFIENELTDGRVLTMRRRGLCSACALTVSVGLGSAGCGAG